MAKYAENTHLGGEEMVSTITAEEIGSFVVHPGIGPWNYFVVLKKFKMPGMQGEEILDVGDIVVFTGTNFKDYSAPEAFFGVSMSIDCFS